MTKPSLKILKLVLIFAAVFTIYPELIWAASKCQVYIQQNPSDKKVLLNGRIWYNQYSKAVGDQFFLSATFFLKGSVTYNGRKFSGLDLQYDIANDELILKIGSYPVIIMNKEMVDSFNLLFGTRNYHIINAGNDTSGILKGYVNVLYDGPTALYTKYTKKILPLAVDGRYDLFIQEHRIYLKKGTEIVPVAGKRRFFELLADKKKEIRHFLKSDRIKVKQKDPDTFVPVLKYYDSIRE